MQSEISPAKGLNMKLVPSLLVFAIAAGVVPDAAAGQKARPDPVARGLDVPSIPAQETPIVLAQAATPGAGATPQPDFTLNICKETESTGGTMSPFNGVSPTGMLRYFMQNKYNRPVDSSAIKNVTLLQDTQHGKIISVVNNTGRPWYRYDPTPNYIGNDRAVFLAEFEGKVYKIVVELHVFRTVNENNPTCSEPQLIKVTKPSSGATGGFWGQVRVLGSGLTFQHSPFLLPFSNGQATQT